MWQSILLLFVCASTFAVADDEKAIAAEWKKLREELRQQGYPVASYVEGDKAIAADMARVKREIERREGKAFVSDLQRVGGGGGGVPNKKKSSGLEYHNPKAK